MKEPLSCETSFCPGVKKKSGESEMSGQRIEQDFWLFDSPLPRIMGRIPEYVEFARSFT